MREGNSFGMEKICFAAAADDDDDKNAMTRYFNATK
jgi:hypothetical protein